MSNIRKVGLFEECFKEYTQQRFTSAVSILSWCNGADNTIYARQVNIVGGQYALEDVIILWRSTSLTSRTDQGYVTIFEH